MSPTHCIVGFCALGTVNNIRSSEVFCCCQTNKGLIEIRTFVPTKILMHFSYGKDFCIYSSSTAEVSQLWVWCEFLIYGKQFSFQFIFCRILFYWINNFKHSICIHSHLMFIKSDDPFCSCVRSVWVRKCGCILYIVYHTMLKKECIALWNKLKTRENIEQNTLHDTMNAWIRFGQQNKIHRTTFEMSVCSFFVILLSVVCLRCSFFLLFSFLFRSLMLNIHAHHPIFNDLPFFECLIAQKKPT